MRETEGFLCVAALCAAIGGCVATDERPNRNDAGEAVDQITPEKAVAILQVTDGYLCGDFSKSCFGFSVKNFKRIRVIDDTALAFGDDGDAPVLPLAGLKVGLVDVGLGFQEVVLNDNFYIHLNPPPLGVSLKKETKSLAEALGVVSEKLRSRQKQQVDFEAVVQSYRNAEVKPLPGEDVRRYKIQAEAAVRAKRFKDAADRYADGLQIAPWWPEGRFNRALVLGEIGEFREAVIEMRRYLNLVPDAPNARLAQDKIYEWEAGAHSSN